VTRQAPRGHLYQAGEAELARIFPITLPRWAFTVISLMAKLAANPACSAGP